jgi:hypothetical protein
MRPAVGLVTTDTTTFGRRGMDDAPFQLGSHILVAAGTQDRRAIQQQGLMPCHVRIVARRALAVPRRWMCHSSFEGRSDLVVTLQADLLLVDL